MRQAFWDDSHEIPPQVPLEPPPPLEERRGGDGEDMAPRKQLFLPLSSPSRPKSHTEGQLIIRRPSQSAARRGMFIRGDTVCLKGAPQVLASGTLAV